MQPGDIVVVRAGGDPLVLVKIVSKAVPYVPEGKHPEFDGWLATIREVEILSWYKEDREKYSIPRFSGSSYIPTCTKYQ